MKFGYTFPALISLIILSQQAAADVVCAKAKLSNGKIKLSSVTLPGTVCPKKSTKLFDTSSLINSSSLTGIPAGGALSGFFPSPELAVGAVDTSALADVPRVRVTRKASQTMPSLAITPVLFDHEEFDIGSMYPGSGGEVTIPQDGIYEVSATMHWAVAGAGSRTLRLALNGALIEQSSTAPVNDGPTDSSLIVSRRFQAGDKLKIEGLQSSQLSLFIFDPNVPGYHLNAAALTVVWSGN